MPAPAPAFPQPAGWPHVFSPEDRGLAIDDVWPSLYVGAERVPEMRRKVTALPWAAAALAQWRAEAETILPEAPRFAAGAPGGRCGLYTDEDGHHLVFDPTQRERMWDPIAGSWVVPGELQRDAWTQLSHERVRRLLSSLGFLYALTGDARYSAWVWAGLRAAALDLYLPANVHPKDPFSVVYGGLYEAQSMLQLLQAYDLVAAAPGASDEGRAALHANVFVPVGEALSRWMDKMIVHNMSCWSMAALALLGRRVGRREWVEKALHSERCGLRLLLTRGLPRAPDGGPPDGFWHETSTFYNFYAVIPLIALYRLGVEEGVVDAELREHFAAAFAAPLHLVDERLRFCLFGDRTQPGRFTLPLLRHFYEYAAGQVDAGRYGPVLALLYAHTGAPRNHLAALAFGPDALPPPAPPPAASVVLPAARLVTFRRDTPLGRVSLWFLGGEDNHPGQAHHHHDKLAIALHAGGELVAPDIGLPAFHAPGWQRFLNGTLAHNTLFLDEASHGPMASVAFAADRNAPVPWARAAVRGDRLQPGRASLWKTMLGRKDELVEGLYDGATLARTVWFDPPFIVLSDALTTGHGEERRCGFIFHAFGTLRVETVPAPGALALAPLWDTDSIRVFAPRTTAAPLGQLTADWLVRDDLRLHLVVTADTPFEGNWGRTPGSPREESRGTVLLRAPGAARRFGAVLELHAGTPRVVGVGLGADGALTARLAGGGERTYAPPPAE